MAIITRLTKLDVPWHDIKQPSLDDLKTLAKKFDLTPGLTEALLLPTVRPQVAFYDKVLFIALHFPRYEANLGRVTPAEIDFAVSAKGITTVHYEPLPFIEELVPELTNDQISNTPATLTQVAQLIAKILERLNAFELRQLDHIEKDIREIEDQAFKTDDKNLVKHLAQVRRNIIHFRHILRPQQFIFKNLATALPKILGAKTAPIIAPVYEDYQRVLAQLTTHGDTVKSLQDTHFALLSVHSNQVMALFSVIAVFVVAFSAMPPIFEMYPDLSVTTRWLIITEITLIGLTVIAFLRHRRWL